MSVDAYEPGTSSQTTFLEGNDLIGADTQASQFDFRDFTLPSQSQAQASQLDSIAGSSNAVSQAFTRKLSALSNGLADLQFEEEDDDSSFLVVKEFGILFD